jgi:hypothetical protein
MQQVDAVGGVRQYALYSPVTPEHPLESTKYEMDRSKYRVAVQQLSKQMEALVIIFDYGVEC